MPKPIPARRAFRHCRRGAAAVELAIVTPLFLLLLAGIIEFGQAFRIQHVLSTAARRGARSAIVEEATLAQIVRDLKADCLRTLNANEGDVDIIIMVAGKRVDGSIAADEGDEVSVSVSVPFSKVGAGFYASMLSDTVLSATCTMEHE